MAKRIKPALSGLTIDSFEKLDKTVSTIASHQEAIERIKLKMESNIAAEKLKAAEAIAPLQARIKELSLAAGIYAQDNREELLQGEAKSRELTLGVIGWRLSTTIKVKSKFNWSKILLSIQGLQQTEEFKKLNLPDAIRIKEAEVNKDALYKWPDDQLAKVGARRVIADEFYIEIKKETPAQNNTNLN